MNSNSSYLFLSHTRVKEDGDILVTWKTDDCIALNIFTFGSQLHIVEVTNSSKSVWTDCEWLQTRPLSVKQSKATRLQVHASKMLAMLQCDWSIKVLREILKTRNQNFLLWKCGFLCTLPGVWWFPLSYPADSEENARPSRADTSEAVSQSPVEKVLRDEGEDGEAHGRGQHVEDPCHVVNIQLTGHHLILLIVANSCEPLGF